MKKAFFIFFVILFMLPSYAECPENIDKYLIGHSLAVVEGQNVKFYEGRGIKPLVNYLDKNDFKGACVADKAIGKASALLLVYGGAKNVYTPLISRGAVEVFEANNVNFKAQKTVDNILNRRGDDLCPMEKAVLDIDNPKKAYKTLKKAVKNL